MLVGTSLHGVVICNVSLPISQMDELVVNAAVIPYVLCPMPTKFMLGQA